MKKLSLFFLLVSSYLFGQNSVSVSLTIPPPYSPYFADYTQLVGQNLLTLTNTTTNTLQVKLLGSITGLDNGLFVNTNPDFMPASPIILAPNQTYTVNASSPSRNFLDINNTTNNLTQEQQISIATSGLIPEGNYLFCIRAADYTSGEFLSPDGTGCALVNVVYPVPPILLVPTCHSEVKIPLPAFAWTGVFVPKSNFLYDLYILKLSEGQIADDAMWLAISGNVGNPFTIKNIQSTGYQYKVSDPPLQQGAKYAWCVVAREQTGKIKIGNLGRSEVCTFDFTSANSGPLVMNEDGNGPAITDTFNLNNTAISGRILYRYYEDQTFKTPVDLTPDYNPTVSVGGVSMNTLEIAQGQTAANRNGNTASPRNNTSGNGFNQLILTSNTADRSTIKIDPSVKYLYHNTLSNNGSDPLRNTPISVYLEYVAVTKNWPSGNDPEKEHFQVVPGMELFYDRSCQNNLGACLDPQITHAAEQMGMQTPTYMFQTRNLGSTQLGSTVTDEMGNFTFDFDLTENTGLLEKEENLLKMEFVTPNITNTPAIDMGQFSPEQAVGNPASTIGGFSGNSMLQGNQGWGGNNDLINGIGGAMNQLGGQNLQLNQQQGPGGPAMPNLINPPDEPLNNCTPYTAEYVFKVIRIKIEDPLYNSPDILIFAQPGESIMLPTVSTFVHSFDVEYHVKAGGLEKDSALLFIKPGKNIPGLTIKQGRTPSFWSSKPDNFPLHEAMDINPAGTFAIENATPHFQNLNSTKPEPLRLSAYGKTGDTLNVRFNRLVPSGIHYFNVEQSLTENYNYTNSWGSVSKTVKLPYAMANAVHSFNFVPEKLIRKVSLQPRPPEILVRVINPSNLQTAGLRDVTLSLLSYTKVGNTYTSNVEGAPAKFGLTDSNGYYVFTNLPIIKDDNGKTMPHRRLCLYKEGYKTRYYPGTNSMQHLNLDENFIAPLRMGERRFTNEIPMEGGASVYGYVRDEEGRPVTALIQIEDGAYQITSTDIVGSNYGSPLRRSVPVETPVTVPSGLVNSFGVFSNLQSENGSGVNPAARTSYSKFSMKAPALQNARVIIQPLSDQYFADTFYVDISNQTLPLNIGTFIVLEKLHRVKVVVTRRQPTIEPAQGARVEIGEHVKTTNSNGEAYFCFPTPDAYFRVFIQDGTRVPIEYYKYLPVSKRYITLRHTTQPGVTVNGKVTDASTGQPIANARIYYQSSTNAYGAVLIETRSDASGNYTLSGLPTAAQLNIACAVNHPDITYIGANQVVTVSAPTLSAINFALNRFSGGAITQIWGFPFELNALQDLGNGKVKVSGALVSVPGNPNFKFSDEQQRVRIQNVVLAASGSQNAQGQNIYQPELSSVATQEHQLRVKLKNAFMADLKGLQSNTLTIKKLNTSDGAISGKVKTDLESFRFSFDYNGAFYLGENEGQPQVNALVSKPQLLPAREYYIMDLNASGAAIPIAFSIHGFEAEANGQSSRLRNDTFLVNTTLLPDIPLCDSIRINAGTIRIDAQHINMPQTGEELEFKLEKWTVKSTETWSYSIPLGGIKIPAALIKTQMANIPVSDLILRPNEILMQQSNMQLNNLSLGSGNISLYQFPNNKAYFYFDPACSADLKPHWRFDLYNENTDKPSCYLQGLKGFDSNAKIKIGAFTVFSDNNTLAQPMTDTTYDFHKVAKVSVYSVANYADAVQLGCTANMQIPGAVTTSLLLSYQAPATREIKSFSLYVESKGKVYFNAYENEATGYKFIDNSFTSTGTLHFENDDPNDGKRIELVGILTRKFENGSYTTEITLPKVSGIYQKIALSGTSGSYLDVIEGLQQVVSGQWDYLRYTGDLVTSDTSTLKDNRLNYVVSGAVEVDKDGNNQIAITDVQTPLGGLCIVFDWSTATFVGTLSISDPGINIGPAVKLKEGLFEIAFSGNGFYFDLVGKVSITGLEAFADVNFGLLAGYYTELPDLVIERHNGIMSLKKVPEELVNEGIKGLYLNLNFSPPAANWDTEIPLVLLTVYAGVNLGIDVAMMLHFGEQTKKFVLDVGAIAGAYAGVNILGVCTFCMSVNGIFDATGEVDLNTGNPNLFGCASLTIKGEAVCMGKLEATAGCTVQFAEKPKDPPVNTPENQGNTDESADNANDTPEIPQTEDNKYPKISLQWTPCGGSDKFNQSNGECGEL